MTLSPKEFKEQIDKQNPKISSRLGQAARSHFEDMLKDKTPLEAFQIGLQHMLLTVLVEGFEKKTKRAYEAELLTHLMPELHTACDPKTKNMIAWHLL